MRVAVVGGGLAGLAATMDLAGDAEVELFEARGNLGGALASVERRGYSIERFYHHLFRSDETLLGLIDGLGLGDRLEWRIGRTSFLVDGEIHPLNTPLEILRYPHLSLLDKARLALFVRRCRKGGYERFDDVPAVEFLRDEVGDSAYRSFFEPLLRSKFGESASEVSGAWVMGRAYIRSHRTIRGEELGYLRGGFGQLVDAMAEEAEERGAEIETGSSVESVRHGEGGVSVEVDGEERDFDAVVATCAPHRMEELLPGFESDVEYQGVCCMVAAADEPLMEGTYWLNLAGDHPFGAVIQHTDLVPVEDYGEHLFYVVSYHQSPDEDNLADPEEKVAERFLSGLEEIFPGMPDVSWWEISRGTDAAPVYETGYLDDVVEKRVGERVYAAGMFSIENYPERSMDGSIRAGFSAAEELRGDLID